VLQDPWFGFVQEEEILTGRSILKQYDLSDFSGAPLAIEHG